MASPSLSLKRGATAFTVTELLVCIVIVAVLAAALLPVFSRVSEKSKQSACLANLRTLWTGATLYAAENRGFLPWTSMKINGGTHEWSRLIAPYIGDPPNWGRYPKKPGGEPGNPFACPATIKNWWLGYGWNYHGIGHGPDDPRGGPTLAGSRPNVVLIADSWYASNPDSAGGNAPTTHSTIAYPLSASAGTQRPVPTPHNNGLNTIFVDGHAEWCQASEFYTKYPFN